MNVDGTAHGDIFTGVGQQVHQHFVEVDAVYPDGQLLHVVIEVHEDHLRLDGVSKHLDDVFRIVDEVGFFHVQVQLSRFQLVNVGNQVNE